MRSLLAFAIAALFAATAAADPETTGDGYTIRVEAPACHPNEHAAARVVIRATGSYHVNREFPTSLEASGPPEVVIAKPKQAARDARIDETQVVFVVDTTPAKAGAFQLSAKLRFAICAADACLPRKAQTTWTVSAR